MDSDGAQAEKMKIKPLETQRPVIRLFQFYDLKAFYQCAKNDECQMIRQDYLTGKGTIYENAYYTAADSAAL